MAFILAIIMGDLLGCSNMALYLSMWNQVDIRSAGSGNLGASNAVIVMGWVAGVLTAVHDIGKGILAVLLARMLFPGVEHIDGAAGAACVLGHIYPFYLKFKGGKGFASYLGMTIGLNWKFSLAVLILVVVVTLITDYIVAATTATIVIVPIGIGILTQSLIGSLILLIASVTIAWKHRENYVRIFNGTEIGFRSAGRGDHRVKK